MVWGDSKCFPIHTNINETKLVLSLKATQSLQALLLDGANATIEFINEKEAIIVIEEEAFAMKCSDGGIMEIFTMDNNILEYIGNSACRITTAAIRKENHPIAMPKRQIEASSKVELIDVMKLSEVNTSAIDHHRSAVHCQSNKRTQVEQPFKPAPHSKKSKANFGILSLIVIQSIQSNVNANHVTNFLSGLTVVCIYATPCSTLIGSANMCSIYVEFDSENGADIATARNGEVMVVNGDGIKVEMLRLTDVKEAVWALGLGHRLTGKMSYKQATTYAEKCRWDDFSPSDMAKKWKTVSQHFTKEFFNQLSKHHRQQTWKKNGNNQMLPSSMPYAQVCVYSRAVVVSASTEFGLGQMAGGFMGLAGVLSDSLCNTDTDDRAQTPPRSAPPRPCPPSAWHITACGPARAQHQHEINHLVAQLQSHISDAIITLTSERNDGLQGDSSQQQLTHAVVLERRLRLKSVFGLLHASLTAPLPLAPDNKPVSAIQSIVARSDSNET